MSMAVALISPGAQREPSLGSVPSMRSVDSPSPASSSLSWLHLAPHVEEAEQRLGGPVVRLGDHQLQPLVHGAPLRARRRPLGHLGRERDGALRGPPLDVEGDEQLEEAGRVRRHEVVARRPAVGRQVVGVRERRGARPAVGPLRAPAAEADVGGGQVGVEQHLPAPRRAPVDLHVGGLDRPPLRVEPDHRQVDPGREGGAPQRDGAAATAGAAALVGPGVHQLVEPGVVEREQQRVGQRGRRGAGRWPGRRRGPLAGEPGGWRRGRGAAMAAWRQHLGRRHSWGESATASASAQPEARDHERLPVGSGELMGRRL